MIDMVWVGRRSAQKMAEKRLGKSWVLETNRGKVVSECRHELFQNAVMIYLQQPHTDILLMTVVRH